VNRNEIIQSFLDDAARPLRGEIFAHRNCAPDAQGECSEFSVVHEDQHGNQWLLACSCDTLEEAEVVAARAAKQLGALYVPLSCKPPTGGPA